MVAFGEFRKEVEREPADGGLFYRDYVKRWSDKRWGRFEALDLREDDYTSLICAAYGTLQSALVEHFLDATGQNDRNEAHWALVSARDLATDRMKVNGRATQRAPDIFVARSPDTDPRQWEPVVCIEAKFKAQVNGDLGYCPAGIHSPWSNQLICYLDECWVGEKDRDPARSYFWMSATDAPVSFAGALTAGMYLVTKDGNSEEVRLENSDEHVKTILEWQTHARAKWRYGSHAQVLEILREHSPTVASYLAACNPLSSISPALQG